jgi:hypothetical protein
MEWSYRTLVAYGFSSIVHEAIGFLRTLPWSSNSAASGVGFEPSPHLQDLRH